MNKKRFAIDLLAALAVPFASFAGSGFAGATLPRHETPQWYKDAKFGIFCHWGPQCIPEAGDWYAREMYFPGNWRNTIHKNRYGDPKEFGFKDLIPLWNAEKWDPQELCSLFARMGARYVQAMGNHHDNFDMWDSTYQPWNSVNMGPKKDILKGWSEAAKANGMRFGVSMHAAHAWSWMNSSRYGDGLVTKAEGKGKWWEGHDPQDLYVQAGHEPNKGWEKPGGIHGQWQWGNGADRPSEKFMEGIYRRSMEAVTKCGADLIYFDDSVLPFHPIADWGWRIVREFYAANPDAVATGKDLNDEQKRYLTWDVERGIPPTAMPEHWQTDTCIGSWHYDRGIYDRNGYKSAAYVLRLLVDVVSKNGNLCLSIPIRADGSIDEKERAICEDIAAWMKVNGEGIHDTVPWKVCGEGPQLEKAAEIKGFNFNEGRIPPATADDFRYTATKDGKTVYAFALVPPPDGVTPKFKALENETVESMTRLEQVKDFPACWKVVLGNGERRTGNGLPKSTRKAFPDNAFREVPGEYLRPCDRPGKVLKFTYTTRDNQTPGSADYKKDCMVYLPYGYDADKAKRYDILYLMHGGGGKITDYIGDGAANVPSYKHMLDHMIANGELAPVIVCSLTYNTPYCRDATKNCVDFHYELRRDIIPAVEAAFRTCAENVTSEELARTRWHRAFSGFSMGACATWAVFGQMVDCIACYIPTSGDCWTYGRGDFAKTARCLASDLAAKGAGPEDFRVYSGAGRHDIALPNLTPLVDEMRKIDSMFKCCDNFSTGNLYKMVFEKGGHDFGTILNVAYNGLPKIFDTVPAGSGKAAASGGWSYGKSPHGNPGVVFGTDIDARRQMEDSAKLAQRVELKELGRRRDGRDLHLAYWFEEAGEESPFRVITPIGWDGKSKLPLVMILHGGWGNENNYIDQRDGEVIRVAEEHGYLLVSPKGAHAAYGNTMILPGGFGKENETAEVLAKVDARRVETNAISEKDVINVLEIVLAKYPVDRARMFLFGHSMGGGGTWYIGGKYSKYWRALAPMSGPFVTEKGYPWENLREKPIFVTEGTRAFASLESSRKLRDFLRREGFRARYREYDANHPDMFPKALKDVFDFFGAQNGVPPPAPCGPVPTERQLWWQDLETYAFIHYSLNTYTDQEWGYGNESPKLFNPEKLDARQWARVCRESGMKGAILTAKHHCGFCLWPSKYTDYSVKSSPWKGGKGDVVREFADACRAEGIKFAVYLSPWDRNHPEYGRPAYVEYFRNQLKELLTEYGDVFEVWFDGANGGNGWYGGANETRRIDKSYYGWEETFKMIRKLQPDALIWNDGGARGDLRWIGNEAGCCGERNWSLLNATGDVSGGELNSGREDGDSWVPGETNTSIRPGWFHHYAEDGHVKSLSKLMDIYYKSVGRNSTLLLNFPISPDGLIPEEDAKRGAAFAKAVKEAFKEDLAKGAKATADNVRGKCAAYSASNAVDGNPETYWATDDGVTRAALTVDFGKPTTFNRVVACEYIRLGQRVRRFSMEAFVDGEWREIRDALGGHDAQTTVGRKRILCVSATTATKLRFTVLDAKACPLISTLGVYNAPELTADIPDSGEKRCGMYHVFFAGHRQMNIDLGGVKKICGFRYKPPRDGKNGVVTHYSLSSTVDWAKWEKLASGEFSNVVNNPIWQTVKFKPVDAGIVSFTADCLAEGDRLRYDDFELLLEK